MHFFSEEPSKVFYPDDRVLYQGELGTVAHIFFHDFDAWLVLPPHRLTIPVVLDKEPKIVIMAEFDDLLLLEKLN